MRNAEPFVIGEGSQLPSIYFQMLPNGGATVLSSPEDAMPVGALDLTDHTLYFRLLKDAALVFESQAEIHGDPALGIGRYDWQGDDTFRDGMFEAEVIVFDSTGREQTFPGPRYISVAIRSRIGDEMAEPKKFQVWDTVNSLAALQALATAGFVPGKTFFRVRDINKIFALDGQDGPEDEDAGRYDTLDDPALQWFAC